MIPQTYFSFQQFQHQKKVIHNHSLILINLAYYFGYYQSEAFNDLFYLIKPLILPIIGVFFQRGEEKWSKITQGLKFLHCI